MLSLVHLVDAHWHAEIAVRGGVVKLMRATQSRKACEKFNKIALPRKSERERERSSCAGPMTRICIYSCN